jgi:serine protease Do
MGRDWTRGMHFDWGGPRKLGISYQEISGQLAGYFKVAGDSGVLVTEVDADGPAGKAGLKAGDVILAFNGQEISDGSDLRRAVRDAENGREVTLKVQREGRPLDLSVTLADRGRDRRRGVGI